MGKLLLLPVLILVQFGCDTKNSVEQSTTLPGDTIIKEDPDGTITLPDPEKVAECVENGFNSSICILKNGHFYYTAENGGRTPDRSQDVNAEVGKISSSIPDGYYPGTTKIKFSDSDLAATNIRSGVNIFGVAGTMSVDGGLPPTCDLTIQPVTFAGISCLLSKDLYVYSTAYGGRSNMCVLNNSSLAQKNCWIDNTSKYYLSNEQMTPVTKCTPDPATSMVPQQCWADIGTVSYTKKYGGRDTACSTDESINATPCWVDSITPEVQGFVTSTKFTNWCLWDQKTTSDCRIRVNVAVESGDSPTPTPKTAGYVYQNQYGGRGNLCKNDNDGFCWTTVDKPDLEKNLIPEVIKSGVIIFGVEGKFRGEGSWKSGAHRDSYAYPVALSDESGYFAGSGSQETGLPDGYREVPLATRDTDTTFTASYTGVDRTGWGNTTCGTGDPSHNLPTGYTTWTLRARMAHCGDVFGLNAIWNGQNLGNAGQSKWRLVTRSGSVASGRGKEVWLDDNTGMLWSSLVSTNTTWCRASGNSEAGTPCATNIDAGKAVSACHEGTNFTTTHASISNDGKAGLLKASTPLPVAWRIPTLYDFEVAEYNGIRFVLPDMGKALPASSTQYEWLATIKKGTSGSKAWVFSSKTGSHATLSLGFTAGVRCIGRTNILD